MLFAGDARELGSEAVTLAPAGVPARLAPGLGDEAAFAESCLRIATEGPPDGSDGALVLPPLMAGDALLEPTPLVLRSQVVAAPACAASELVLGPACASIGDDRVILRAPEAASLFALESPERRLAVVEPGASLAVRGLQPGSEARITGSGFDSAGRSFALDMRVRAAPHRDHLVLNEVLANPVGAEAASEWIELVNDGLRAVELGGYVLVDPGGSFALPDATLAPGELALLVGPEFAPDPELDIPVPGGVQRGGRAPRGKTGHPHGRALFGRVGPPRRSPGAADDEPASFGPHAAPGASPGAPNALSSR
jgi:hypothetical protein